MILRRTPLLLLLLLPLLLLLSVTATSTASTTTHKKPPPSLHHHHQQQLLLQAYQASKEQHSSPHPNSTPVPHMLPHTENLMNRQFVNTLRTSFKRSFCANNVHELPRASRVFQHPSHARVGDFGFMELTASSSSTLRRTRGMMRASDKPFPGFTGPVDIRKVDDNVPDRQYDYGRVQEHESWEQSMYDHYLKMGKVPKLEVQEGKTLDPVFAFQVNKTTEGMMTCYDRRKVPSWESFIRPGLLTFRDEVLQTIPGATIWLNEGITKLLTESKQSVKDVARMFVAHQRVIEKSPARDPYTAPASWAKLFDEEWCHVSDPCTDDERCLIWHLMLLATLGADDMNSTPTDRGEQVKPPAKSGSNIVGTEYWCDFPVVTYEESQKNNPDLQGIERDPKPIPYTREPDFGSAAESTQASRMSQRAWGY